ncbi:MAG: hypothetical protein WKF81_12840 [Thermomicrobiales bacterium]
MNAIRRFLRLLWIEIQRSPAALVSVLGLVLAWLIRDNPPRGVVIWNDISQSVADGHLVIAPLGAAIAVWSVGRSRRRGVSEQEVALPLPAGSSELIITLAVMFWMVSAYASFFVLLAIPGWRFATWGSPNLPMILIGALATCACVAIGSIISRFGRSVILSPVTLIATYGAMVYVSDSLWYSDTARLVPIKFLSDNGFNFDVRQPADDFLWFCAWMATLTVTLIFLQLLLRSRSLLRVAAIVLSIGLASTSATQVVAGPRFPTQPTDIPVNPVCEMASQFEVCVHPAMESLLDEVIAEVNEIAPNFAGLTGLPTTLYQTELVDPFASGIARFHVWDKTTIGYVIPETFTSFTSASSSLDDGTSLSASQCAVGMALTETAGDFPHCVYGVVYESANQSFPPGNELGQRGPDQAARDEAAREISDKAKSFAALTPEVRQAWLDENWDALRAGELELDDLP